MKLKYEVKGRHSSHNFAFSSHNIAVLALLKSHNNDLQ